ncbi:MAG: glycoside hydrolase family 19 protein [Alphaproteobacteria bacterium]|nr:glycoside hydrolase family 19 protein [Alphaproteobacteria bacterium]
MTAIVELQKKCGVTADGVWGPTTYKAARAYFKLTKERAAHFFGQCAHETGNFKIFEENLNYSSGGLLKIFPKYFNQQTAVAYERQPQRIANRVYANRMGNSDEASGDGWKYRGRGAIQLTGKANYAKFGHADSPDKVANELAFESALFFFEQNGLWTICDKGVTDATITALTKRVNGGTNGLDDRLAKTKLFYSWV